MSPKQSLAIERTWLFLHEVTNRQNFQPPMVYGYMGNLIFINPIKSGIRALRGSCRVGFFQETLIHKSAYSRISQILDPKKLMILAWQRRVQDHHMSSILVKPFLHKLEFTIIEKLQCLGAKTRPGYRTTVIKVQKSEKYLIFEQLQPCTLVNNYFVWISLISACEGCEISWCTIFFNFS